MPVTPYPPIDTDVSDPPNRGQAQAVFSPKMDAFLAAFQPLKTEQNALAAWMESIANQTEGFANTAGSSASDADQYAQIAMSVANFKGEWSDQSGAAPIPYSVWHSGNVYALLSNLADVSSVEPGTDPAIWADLTSAMSGYTNPLTTKGDLIVADTGGVQIRFPAPTTSGLAALLRYDVDTQTLSWADEDSYLGGGSGGNGELEWVDKGNVATSGSETVTIDFSAGRFQVMSMETANTTGTLTLQLTNFPVTTNKTATMLLFIRRGGRKPVSISASGFTINYAQGTAGTLNSTSNYYDVYEVLKKFGSTQLDVTHVRTGIF